MFVKSTDEQINKTNKKQRNFYSKVSTYIVYCHVFRRNNNTPSHNRKNLCMREMEKDMKKELEVVLDYCWRLILHSHLLNAIPKVDFEL